MTHMWQFKTKNFAINWQILPDNDLDLSWDHTGEVKEKLARGEYEAFQSHVYVVFIPTGATVGEAWLSGSIYARPKEFRDHIGMNAKGHGSYFSDMVREACAEARKNFKQMQSLKIRYPER